MKRILTLLLALVMLFCLTACGGDKESAPTGENTGATTNTTKENEDPTDGTQDGKQNTTDSTTGRDGAETTPPTTTPPTTTDNPVESPITKPSANNDISQVKEKAKSIVGRWYLKGYADVYLDITYEDNQDQYGPYVVIFAENFSFKDNGVSDGSGSYHINEYTIYPIQYNEKYPNGISWTPGISVFLSGWGNTLAEYKIQIENSSIHIDAYDFVRTKGTKTQQTEVGGNETPPATEPPITIPPVTDPPTTEPQPVRVSGVRISKTTLSLNVGDTQQLTANISPSNADNKSVTWSSSNSSVAQVSSTGKITAKGVGSATITVTTVDGNYAAKCTVTVATPPATEPPATEPPVTEPVSDVLIISNTQTISNQTIDTDVYITSSGIATFNNVTVNGNIYCYGQLKCSGCTANNVYAYAYGSMMSCGAFDGTHGKVSGGISCNNMTILDNALDYAFNKWGKR